MDEENTELNEDEKVDKGEGENDGAECAPLFPPSSFLVLVHLTLTPLHAFLACDTPTRSICPSSSRSSSTAVYRLQSTTERLCGPRVWVIFR